ncbi:TolC family protein [Pseudoalteromonas sp. MMG013]|uniref:efflux transporter outer membrane subunit n=1 Tax=unclassified Pseudoalteromonas TaxID=194690 RepID=UPI001B382AB6|nr:MULTISPECIES: TolC family protein [unclassified Pseudoalteromonas]MBQ4847727.1 TolC family protein [Pseudoalteromonas sp. MMG005]MBQ4863061.1 TolC family protein [Pseudoalteromonas sp. MMG013]
MLKITAVSVAVAIVLTGCTSTFDISPDYQQNLVIPSAWQYPQTLQPVDLNWLEQFSTSHLHQLVDIAIENNRVLKQQQLAVESAKQQLIVSGSALWPSLDMSLDSSRRKNASSGTTGNSHALDLTLRYELDVWGKLSAGERRDNLSLLAQQETLSQHTYDLVAKVVIAWFSVIESQGQLSLLQERVELAKQNLDIIENGYKQGLNNALDVYLTRNEQSNEKAKLASQSALSVQKKRELERLLGHYPAGLIEVEATLPVIDSALLLGLPSELIRRKPELRASWHQLLAQDAALAYAHKQRFPSLNLTAKYGTSSDDLADLLSSSSVGWSLLSGITAPLFNAGKLAANEEKARIELQVTELSYLEALHHAFEQVENGITNEQSLQRQYENTSAAATNAKLAEQLSFAQYQKGLVSYTTVLDAQKRSFEAQSGLISIKNQIIKNRVELHLALGGDFQSGQVKGTVNE